MKQRVWLPRFAALTALKVALAIKGPDTAAAILEMPCRHISVLFPTSIFILF